MKPDKPPDPRTERERLVRAWRQAVKALDPVPPASDGEVVYLLVPDAVPHDDPEICRVARLLGCNAVVSGTAAHTYHNQALVAGCDLSGPVIWRHRREPEPPTPEDRIAALEALVAELRQGTQRTP